MKDKIRLEKKTYKFIVYLRVDFLNDKIMAEHRNVAFLREGRLHKNFVNKKRLPSRSIRIEFSNGNLQLTQLSNIT